MDDLVGTNGVIAIGFGGDSTWQLVRLDKSRDHAGNGYLGGYRYIVECIETRAFLGFVDIEEAALCLKEVVA